MLNLLKWLLSFFLRRPLQATEKPVDAFKSILGSRVAAGFRKNALRMSTGPNEVTIWYVKGMNENGTLNQDTPNQFNDIRGVFINDNTGKPITTHTWIATVDPSRYWTINPMNPKGAAQIKMGQYTAWQVGIHNGSHEALVQTGGPVTVYRDKNKDFKREGDVEDTGYFGINQHWGYDLPITDLANSSAGCLVGRAKDGHREFMKDVKSDPRYLENNKFIFTTTIFDGKLL